jgi:uncharacterized membrane protein YphA (DoxX/SURF4 family)
LLPQLLKVQLQTKPAEAIYFFGRLGLAGLFLWSGLSKGYDPGFFAEIIAAFGLLPGALIYPVAIFLIVIELAVGLGLLIEQKGALGGSTVLLLLFMAVLGYGIYLGLDIDCGCFGSNDPEAQAFHNLRGSFIRDLLLLLVIFYLYLWRFVNRSKDWTGDGGCQTITEEA